MTIDFNNIRSAFTRAQELQKIVWRNVVIWYKQSLVKVTLHSNDSIRQVKVNMHGGNLNGNVSVFLHDTKEDV